MAHIRGLVLGTALTGMLPVFEKPVSKVRKLPGCDGASVEV